MPARVLQIIPTLVQGGAEKQCTLLATRLPRDEFEVHVAVLTHTGPYERELVAAGIPVHHIHKRWKVDPFAYFRLKKLIRDLQPQIVQTWLFAANSYGRSAAKSAGIKHILASERCVDPWKSTPALWLDRYQARYTEKIVTNSSGVVDFYKNSGIPADKFVVIPNGIPEKIVSNTSLTRNELLKSLNLPADGKLVGTIGRLWPQKRMKDAIWATDLLKCIRDDVHLLIIGDGPQRKLLEQFRAKVEIEDRVHFLGHRKDIAELLPHLDAFWLCSGYEGQSNSVMEAMQAGVPVIATDIPGNRDLMQSGEHGFLVDIGDRSEFAKKTELILNDATLRTKLITAAQHRMRTEFSLDKMIDGYAELYRSLLR